ncbi:MAG: class II aldolase/adducin family protein, partial [Verrucomicrobia bacterium]
NSEFRPGVVCMVPPREACGCDEESAAMDPEVEAIVRKVTEAIMARLTEQ